MLGRILFGVQFHSTSGFIAIVIGVTSQLMWVIIMVIRIYNPNFTPKKVYWSCQLTVFILDLIRCWVSNACDAPLGSFACQSTSGYAEQLKSHRGMWGKHASRWETRSSQLHNFMDAEGIHSTMLEHV